MRLLTPRPPRVSLISAVYGVARYLPRFLSSLDAQVHPHDRLQVVLVLDGASHRPARGQFSWWHHAWLLTG